jgi:hypothetical protein
MGFARPFRPTYAGANMGHPEGFRCGLVVRRVSPEMVEEPGCWKDLALSRIRAGAGRPALPRRRRHSCESTCISVEAWRACRAKMNSAAGWEKYLRQ